jgi:hypothetical protein
MSEYGWRLDYLLTLTKEQMILFKKRAETRIIRRDKNNAKLHGADIKGKGLDVDGAVPIEEAMSRGKNSL